MEAGYVSDVSGVESLVEWGREGCWREAIGSESVEKADLESGAFPLKPVSAFGL